LEKPEACAICYEALAPTDEPQACGHYLHTTCLRKHFKPECAICRAPLKIQVQGQLPSHDQRQWEPIFPVHTSPVLDYVYERTGVFLFTDNDLPDLEDTALVGRLQDYLGDESDEETGCLYAEERGDYDEENPHSDNWNYEDV